jgi:excisionase family DNA binding protein
MTDKNKTARPGQGASSHSSMQDGATSPYLADATGRHGHPDEPRTAQRIAVSVDEAVTLTGLSRSTVFRLVQTGELPSLKVGRRRLIRVVDLDGYIESLVGAQ